MPGKITIYVDIVSPFGYMGYYMLRHAPVFKDVEKTVIPIFLGGLMKSTGNITPLFVKNKDKWIDRERLRWARQFSIPMCRTLPPGFPINLIKANRALAYIQRHHPTHLIPAVDALFAEFWGQDVSNADVAKPDGPRGFLAVLDKVLPKNVSEDLVKGWASDEAKEQLAANTKLAENNEVFGLPWFACENEKGEKEGFWGVDHLGVVVRFMGLQAQDKEILRALL